MLNFLRKTKDDLFNHFFTDFSYSPSLAAFEQIKMNSECIFAKRSNLWGPPHEWDSNLTVKQNINK